MDPESSCEKCKTAPRYFIRWISRMKPAIGPFYTEQDALDHASDHSIGKSYYEIWHDPCIHREPNLELVDSIDPSYYLVTQTPDDAPPLRDVVGDMETRKYLLSAWCFSDSEKDNDRARKWVNIILMNWESDDNKDFHDIFPVDFLVNNIFDEYVIDAKRPEYLAVNAEVVPRGESSLILDYRIPQWIQSLCMTRKSLASHIRSLATYGDLTEAGEMLKYLPPMKLDIPEKLLDQIQGTTGIDTSRFK